MGRVLACPLPHTHFYAHIVANLLNLHIIYNNINNYQLYYLGAKVTEKKKLHLPTSQHAALTVFINNISNVISSW